MKPSNWPWGWMDGRADRTANWNVNRGRTDIEPAVPEEENFHPTTRLVDPKGEPADIDVELAPLVQLLWRLGIETITCCQDVGESIAPLARDLPHVASEAERLRGSAQVDFPIDPGLRFLTAVAP